MTTIDPVDNLTFWHTNEYYPVTSSANWFTRVGKFQFPMDDGKDVQALCGISTSC